MKKVLVIGSTNVDGLLIQSLKEKFGEDVKLYTPEEAQAEGLTQNDFANIPTYTIKPTPVFEDSFFIPSLKVGKGGRARNRSDKKNKIHK